MDLHEYHTIYSEIWQFFKKHAVADPESWEYLDIVIDEASEITNKYPDCGFERNIIVAILEELVEIYKIKLNAE